MTLRRVCVCVCVCVCHRSNENEGWGEQGVWGVGGEEGLEERVWGPVKPVYRPIDELSKRKLHCQRF